MQNFLFFVEKGFVLRHHHREAVFLFAMLPKSENPLYDMKIVGQPDYQDNVFPGFAGFFCHRCECSIVAILGLFVNDAFCYN